MNTGILSTLVLLLLAGFSSAFVVNSPVVTSGFPLCSASTETAVDDDVVIQIQPNAMERLRELKEKSKQDSLVLRMGIKKGGCSGMSYVMDFSTEEEIQPEDTVHEYAEDKIKCVVESKALLYLYGLQLDYSDALVGGGFKFSNPNAEKSCSCGSSFGV